MAANKRDYYEILGVARTATDDEIKKSFRRLAKQYHPDANKEQGAEARFIEINEAYEVLSDQQKRTAYDRYGHAGVGAGAAGAGFNDFGGIQVVLTISLRRSSQGRLQVEHSAVVERKEGLICVMKLTITFEEAVFGCQKEIELPRWETCGTCRGNGAKPGTSTSRCSACQGTGEIRRVQQSIFGQFVNVTMCERCRGEGRVITTPCEKCRGQGRVRNNRRVVVKSLLASMMGLTSASLVKAKSAHVAAHPATFTSFSQSSHIHSSSVRAMTLSTSCLSASLRPRLVMRLRYQPLTISQLRLKIPAGTQSGRSFRLKGMGVPVVHSSARGDQHVIVKVVTPTNITPEQKHLLEEFARLEKEQSEQDGKNIFRNLFEKTKDVFQ